MIIKKKANYSLIQTKAQGFDDFLAEFKMNYETLKQHHLIVDLTKITNKSSQNVNLLFTFINQSKKLKKSFIVVIQDIEIDSILDQITCTPTLLEALDILEMETIERDLGF